MKQQTIYVLPYNTNINLLLGSISLDQLICYTTSPFNCIQKGKLIRDLTEDDYLICFADNIIRYKRNPILNVIRNNIRANLSLIVAEPNAYDEISSNCIKSLLSTPNKYFRILTFNKELLNLKQEAIF